MWSDLVLKTYILRVKSIMFLFHCINQHKLYSNYHTVLYTIVSLPKEANLPGAQQGQIMVQCLKSLTSGGGGGGGQNYWFWSLVQLKSLVSSGTYIMSNKHHFSWVVTENERTPVRLFWKVFDTNYLQRDQFISVCMTVILKSFSNLWTQKRNSFLNL